MLESILSSIQNLQKGVSRCNDRMSLFESRLEQNEREFVNTETAVNYGAISLLGSEDVSNEVVCKEQAQSPPNEAFKPPNKAIKPPVKAIKPSNAVSGPPNESSISAVPDALVNARSNENTEITSACYEPDAFSTS